MGRSLPETAVAPSSEVSSSPHASRVRVGGYVLAWALSVQPSLVTGELEHALGDGSRLILAALPWVALIGLPATTGRHRDGSRAWLLALGLALPSLCLAGWLDVRAGLEREAVSGIAGFVAVILVLLGEASHQAARGARRLHALCWLAVVPGAAALAAALSWAVDGRAVETGLAGALASVSPIATLWRDFTAGPIPLAAAILRPAALASALLLLLPWLVVRRQEVPR